MIAPPGGAIRVPVARPWMGEAEAEAARRVILSGWVTQGPEVAAFEREFAAAVGAPYACAVSSGTTALHLAMMLVGAGPGDEVVTASHSFIATANAIRHAGATPVFADIEPATLNLDPPKVEAAITPRTKAILVVHQIGMPADLRRLLEVARRHGLPLVEDAACAIGSEILWDGRWERLGRPHGDVACFSFHPRKVVTTGDGGMLTTADAEWDRRLRLWRQHGMSVTDTARHAASQVVFESYPVLGYNYRMTDVQAAIGRVQLGRLDTMLERRRALASRYRGILEGDRRFVLPAEPDWARTNWQSYCIRLADGLDQRAVMQSMLDRGISARRGVMCTHREAAYDGFAHPPLPESERAQDRGIILPLYHQMTEDEQDLVVAALRAASVSREEP